MVQTSIAMYLARYTQMLSGVTLVWGSPRLIPITACVTPLGSFEVRNNITLMVTVCIASFQMIGELQRERLSVVCRSI